MPADRLFPLVSVPRIACDARLTGPGAAMPALVHAPVTSVWSPTRPSCIRAVLHRLVSGVIEQTVDELRDLALEAGDAGGYFPALYVRVTRDIAAGIRDHQFEDGPRMERLVDAFAGCYIRARTAQMPVPRCWQATWDVAGDPNLVIVQHLLLGVNAHVNHDLAQAVVEVAPQHGGLEAVRDDFDTINDVLAGSFAGVIRDLDSVSRWAGEAAALGGGRLFNFSLRVARSQAWGAAERLHPLDEAGRRDYMSELDELVSVLAYLITRPVCPVALAAWLARRFEQRDPRAVTRTLLGTRDEVIERVT
jgi:hypothetical protein